MYVLTADYSILNFCSAAFLIYAFVNLLIHLYLYNNHNAREDRSRERVAYVPLQYEDNPIALNTYNPVYDEDNAAQ